VTRTFALVKPKIVVDGQEVPDSGWGRTVIPLPPGHHEVHVHTPYLLPRRVGLADCTVAVQPNEWVELEYKAPVWNFSPGALGPPPQKYNGMIVAAVVAVLVVCVTAIVVFGVLPSL
jgi:hypothetical protein